jgi:tRNA A-37 threonylcarbamoyl transferase component Bud32
MPFAIGENVGPYRIIEQLGQGGMATVYKAYHPALDRYVAIKVLHPAFLEDPNFLARFNREAKVVAKLDHPNIVPIYDYADHKGQPYLVMKFIEGETLKARLARSPLSVPEAVHVVEAVGGALAFAHQKGILHRDIKPSNIILTPDGPIYLADFGLARIAQSGESTLSADMMLGTPHYISPEQARGERDLDEGTDIYSFGVVLYEIVVGRVPFSADTPFSIIHDHIYTPLPPPCVVNPRVPEAMQAVLMKALDKPRENRFATVPELVEAFRAAATGSPLGGSPELSTVTQPAATRPGQNREDSFTAVETETPPMPAPTTVPGDAASRAPEAEVPKKRKTWIWAVGGLAITCLCLLGFVWFANRQYRNTSGESSAAGPALFLTERGEPRAVADARASVDARPDDPQARLDLAAAYLARDMNRLAVGELLKAGELFLAGGAYPEAARAFADAVVLRGGPAGAEPDAVDALQHAVYLGAPDEASWEAVERLLTTYPDWDPLLAAASRSRLFQGRNDEARALAEGVLSRNPLDPVATASLLEVLVKVRDPGAAAIADQARNLRDVPGWLRPHLQEILQGL